MTDLLQTGLNFAIEGDPISYEPYTSGHIHETYLLKSGKPDNPKKYIIQGLNANVFKKPESMQDNISRILQHLKNSNEENYGFQDLEIIETREGKNLHLDEEGNYWRCYSFIEDSVTLEGVENPGQAYEGGRSFGYFSARLKNYNPRRLHITIPNFMDMEWRQKQLTYAELTNPGERLRQSQQELKRISDLSEVARRFLQIRPALPDRVAHNDTKITNILFDQESGKGKSVIDLDTVMTGTLLTEFGDMVRSYTSSGGEDETEPGTYTCREDIFQGLVTGYSEAVSSFISDIEKVNLLLGAKAVIYMQAMRFLTDYISNDIYYKTSFPQQNLFRARNQLGLLESLIDKTGLLEDILKRSF